MNYEQTIIIRKALNAMLAIRKLEGQWTARDLEERFEYFYDYIEKHNEELRDLFDNKLPKL